MREKNTSAVSFRVTIVALLAFFAAAGFFTRSVMVRNSETQQHLRAAQLYRARLLRLQIDEETGIRGYADTQSAVFLQPYRNAVKAFPSTAVALSDALRALGADPAAVNEEAAINRRWIDGFAAPMLASSSPSRELSLQLHGKELVDRFRALDSSLYNMLSRRAEEADANTARDVEQILLTFFLAGAIVAVVISLIAVIQARTASELKLQKLAYQEEKRIADMLQEAFIHKTLPVLPATDLHAIYSPAGLEAKVGGDWYDAFELNDGRILFSIGDVAGHGIDAAVVMSRVRQAILVIGVEESDPSVILARANDILLLQDDVMVTAVCGFIDIATHSITYSTAGHPPIIAARANGNIERLPYWGPPLGAADRVTYKAFSARVEPGATLFLYTDGLVEQHRDVVAGETRLIGAIEAVSKRETADPASALMQEMFDGEAPRDDVAILTIRFRESAGGGDKLTPDLGAAAARPVADGPADSLLRSVLPDLYIRRILTGAPPHPAGKDR